MNTFFANTLKQETIKVTEKTSTVTRMSGPYAMFGPGRIIQTVPNTTSTNGRTSLYKITTSKLSFFGGNRVGYNTTVKPFHLFDKKSNYNGYYTFGK